MNKIKKEKRNLNLLKRSSKIFALLTKRGGGGITLCLFVSLFDCLGFFLLKNKVLFKKYMFSLSNALQWIIELNNDLVSW